MNIAHVRTRWAAIGAAVAITLGAGGIGITHATTSSGEKPIYKPITPCRMAAFGAAPFNVGPRTTPIGAEEEIALDGWGTQGECNLPTGTTGLALNVTAVDASTLTYLTFFPHGATLPTTANLNPSPGQPPTPNAVNVGLSAAGKFSLFNKYGTVGVFIDVVGVYDDHNHNDLYYTKAESDAAVGAKANSADVYTKAESDAAFAPMNLGAKAFGYVDSAGVLKSGANVTATSYEAGLQRYVIDLPFSFIFRDFATTVTTTCNGDIARTSSVSGNLLVYITDHAGASTTCGFGFVVFGP